MLTRLFASLLLALASGATLAADSSAPDQYRLLPGDELNVSVWKEVDLQKDVVIAPDGRFSFPLVGDVLAVGRTLPEVRTELVDKLERFIPEAELTVTLKNPKGNRIYVIGQVNKPGEYVVNPMVDVVQALSIAGGMTPFASVDDVRILRRENGRQEMLEFRFGDIAKGRRLEQNVVLRPGDVVVVP